MENQKFKIAESNESFAIVENENKRFNVIIGNCRLNKDYETIEQAEYALNNPNAELIADIACAIVMIIRPENKTKKTKK